MEVIIIYDADYPSTKIIARAIGLSFGGNSRVRFGDAKLLDRRVLPEIDVLIVGTPTQRSKPTKAIRSFLNNLPKNSLENISIGSFETSVKRAFPFSLLPVKRARKKNSTALFIERMLVKKGGIHVLSPERYNFRRQTKPYERDWHKARTWGYEFKELCTF